VPKKTTAEQDPPAENKTQSSHRILVADDDAAIRALLRDFLEEEGYQVTEATSGQEALASLQENSHDLVLLDVRLPGMTGLDVLKQLREKE